ncbi:MAG: serine/threonine-protein kinase [Sandaracinaceae bacterium]
MTGEERARSATRLGRYDIGAEIASGGMATVYLARTSGAAGFEKLFALKRVHSHLAKEAAFIDMFLDEARIAAQLQHPNVCQVFDFGEADGDYFIAMEFLVGETLSKVQRAIAHSDYLNHPRRSHVCGRMIADACEGLHAAHELRGRDGEPLHVVHRDVSPQNLFVTFDGNTKVVDFGIASASGRVHQTSTGTVKGKFAYMAPEQARGQKVDRRADVFALGVVLWELLAFRRLFRRAAPAESLVALLHDDIVPPSQISPLCPPELDAVVMKALERDRDKRYASARELGRDIVRTLARMDDPVDRAEVAEWLDELFPDRRKAHDLMLENAVWGEDAPPPAGPVSEVVSRNSWSGVRPEELQYADPQDVSELPEATPAPLTANAPNPSTVPDLVLPEARITQASDSAISQVSHTHLVAAQQPAPRQPHWALLLLIAVLITALTATGLTLVLLSQNDNRNTGPAVVAVPPTMPTPPTTTTPVAPDPTPDGTESTGSAAVGSEETGSEEGATDAGTAGSGTEETTAPATGRRTGRVGRGRTRRGTTGRRQTPAEQPAAAVTGTGRVRITTPGGWANVFDRNGLLLGETPLTTTLPAGRHRLYLRAYGQPPSRYFSVNVQAGGMTSSRQPLDPQ